MRSIILISLALFFSGCIGNLPIRAEDAPKLPPLALPKIEDPTPPPANKDGKTDPLKEAKYEMQLYSEKAAQAEARYNVLEKQSTQDALRSQTLWISGICLLLAAVCGVAAFMAPLGKKVLTAGAIGFTAVAACAQAFQWAIPYLPWIGGTLLVGGGIWGAINWKKLGTTATTASDYGERVESWLQDLPEDARVKANKIIADAKEEAQKQATALGVHDDLQYLRGKLPSLWQRLTSKIG